MAVLSIISGQNDIVEDIESVIKLFADYISMYLDLGNPHIKAEILNNDLDMAMGKIKQKTNKQKKTPISILVLWKDYFRRYPQP